MKRLRPSGEAEMIREFLSMEIESDRYRDRIVGILNELGLDAAIVRAGDLASERENDARRAVLTRFRGYADRTGLFEHFPERIEWHWAALSAEDLRKTAYVNYSYWNELSAYTGSPLEAARAILAGKTVYGVPNDGFFEAAEHLKKGLRFPPMILLTEDGESRFAILEGHKRMTAYALVPEFCHDVSVLLGYCGRAELDAWHTQPTARDCRAIACEKEGGKRQAGEG